MTPSHVPHMSMAAGTPYTPGDPFSSPGFAMAYSAQRQQMYMMTPVAAAQHAAAIGQQQQQQQQQAGGQMTPLQFNHPDLSGCPQPLHMPFAQLGAMGEGEGEGESLSLVECTSPAQGGDAHAQVQHSTAPVTPGAPFPLAAASFLGVSLQSSEQRRLFVRSLQRGRLLSPQSPPKRSRQPASPAPRRLRKSSSSMTMTQREGCRLRSITRQRRRSSSSTRSQRRMRRLSLLSMRTRRWVLLHLERTGERRKRRRAGSR